MKEMLQKQGFQVPFVHTLQKALALLLYLTKKSEFRAVPSLVLCVKVELAPDVENITNVVEEFCNRNRNKERLYLHFSGGNAKYFSTKQINWVVVGHGVNNAKLEVDKIEKDPRTNRDVIHTNTPDGDCLVGTRPALFRPRPEAHPSSSKTGQSCSYP